MPNASTLDGAIYMYTLRVMLGRIRSVTIVGAQRGWRTRAGVLISVKDQVSSG